MHLDYRTGVKVDTETRRVKCLETKVLFLQRFSNRGVSLSLHQCVTGIILLEENTLPLILNVHADRSTSSFVLNSRKHSTTDLALESCGDLGPREVASLYSQGGVRESQLSLYKSLYEVRDVLPF